MRACNLIGRIFRSWRTRCRFKSCQAHLCASKVIIKQTFPLLNNSIRASPSGKALIFGINTQRFDSFCPKHNLKTLQGRLAVRPTQSRLRLDAYLAKVVDAVNSKFPWCHISIGSSPIMGISSQFCLVLYKFNS